MVQERGYINVLFLFLFFVGTDHTAMAPGQFQGG